MNLSESTDNCHLINGHFLQMEMGAVGNVHVGPAIVVSAESAPLGKLWAEL